MISMPPVQQLTRQAHQAQQAEDERRRNDLSLTTSLMQLGSLGTGLLGALPFGYSRDPSQDTQQLGVREAFLQRLKASCPACSAQRKHTAQHTVQAGLH